MKGALPKAPPGWWRFSKSSRRLVFTGVAHQTVHSRFVNFIRCKFYLKRKQIEPQTNIELWPLTGMLKYWGEGGVLMSAAFSETNEKSRTNWWVDGRVGRGQNGQSGANLVKTEIVGSGGWGGFSVLYKIFQLFVYIWNSHDKMLGQKLCPKLEKLDRWFAGRLKCSQVTPSSNSSHAAFWLVTQYVFSAVFSV